MSEPESRKLVDLRVVDLRSELEKRNIDRTGVKAVLIEKLQKALEDEGHDPEEYVFQISEKKMITPKRTRKGEGDDFETSEEDGKEEDLEGKLDSSNMDDDINNKDNCVENKICNDEDVDKLLYENDEPELKADNSNVEEVIPKDSTAKVEVGSDKKKESAADIFLETNESNKNNEKEVMCAASKDNIERKECEVNILKQILPKPKVLEIRLERTKVGSEIKEDKILPEANGLDNEDSINLTIGEDEEKLLADEDDCCQEKEQKDEGRHPSATSTTGELARKKKSTGESDAVGNNQEEKKEEAMKSGTGGVDRSTNKDDKGLHNDAEMRQLNVYQLSEDRSQGKKVSNSASAGGSSRNLWVSGLSTTTRATDLKQVFSKFGKVIGAKVVTNARTPGARCYGYVTMASSDDASKSIAQLHLTELHGRIILVERAKADSTGPPKRPEALKQIRPLESKKPEERKKLRLTPTSSRSVEEKKKEEVLVPPGTECEKSVEVVVDSSSEPAAPGTEDPDIVCLDLGSGHQSRSKETGVVGVKVVALRHRSAASSHKSKERSPVRPPRKTSPQILSFQQIKEERERQRLQRKERELREEERRRKEERERQRETDRKQSIEAARLEREREKLRLEREKIERERAELLRLERDRLEREKEELNRQKLKLEEARRNKRALSGSREGFEDRKRPAPDRRYTQFTETTRGSDYKKEVREPERVSGRVSGSSRTRYEVEPTSRSRHEESSTIRVREERIKESSRAFVTESRGERDRSFRRGHEERTHTKPRDRYDDSSKDVRFGGNAPEWHGGMKSFAPSSGGSSWVSGAVPRKQEPAPWSRPGPPPADSRSSRPKPWAPSPSSSDRWVSGSAPMSVGSRPGMSGPVMYPPPIGPGVPGMGMPLSNNGPYSGERFDAYKQQMGSMGRKY